MWWQLSFIWILLIVSVSRTTSFRSVGGGGSGGLTQTWRGPSSLHVLNFMTAAVTDLAPSTDIIFDKNTKYSINEASFSDLASIVSLRVNVFYPELKSVVSFHTRILDKMRGRYREGSICMIATKNDHHEDNQFISRRTSSSTSFLNGLSNGLLGAVEFSPSDFKGTPMESIGADRKLYVADLAIRTEARRFGIATQLLLAIELYAFQNHYQEIYLHVEVDNVVARTMYFKNGYIEVPRSEWASIFTQSRLHKSVDAYVFLWKSLVGDRDIKIRDSRASSIGDNRAIERRVEVPTATTTTTTTTTTSAIATTVRKISTEVLSSTLPVKTIKAR